MGRPLAVTFEGLPELDRILSDLAPREATNLARTTVHGIASDVAKRIGAAAPYRHLRRGFRAVRRRGKPGNPVSEVRAKQKAADWRWAEYGTAQRVQKSTGRRTGRMPAKPFVVPRVEQVRREMPAIYREQFAKKLERTLARRRAR